MLSGSVQLDVWPVIVAKSLFFQFLKPEEVVRTVIAVVCIGISEDRSSDIRQIREGLNSYKVLRNARFATSLTRAIMSDSVQFDAWPVIVVKSLFFQFLKPSEVV